MDRQQLGQQLHVTFHRGIRRSERLQLLEPHRGRVTFRLITGEPKGVQRTADSGRVITRWICPKWVLDRHWTPVCLDSAQRAGWYPGRHRLAAADRALLDPQ